jgi:hypothetical protein
MKKTLLDIYNRYKIIIFPALIGLACFLLIILIIIPQFNEYLKAKEDLANTLAHAENLQKKNLALEGLDRNDLQQKLNIAINAFPSEKDFPGVVGLVQRLASERGLALGSLQVVQTSSKTETPSFSVKFDVSGSRASVRELLNTLENSSRVLKVITIEVSASSETDVVANIGIDAFYAPTPTALGGLDAPLSPLTSEENKVLSTLSSIPAPAAEPGTPQLDLSTQSRGKANPFQ